MGELFSRIDLEAATAVAEVERACRSVGFFEVVGHGVDPMVIADMRAAAEAFFALPPEVKQACAPTGSDSNRGYIAKGAETSSYSVGLSAPPDLFEAFNMGGGRSPSATVRPDLRGLYAPDVWPAESIWPHSAMSAYFEAMVPLAYKILDVFAEALELDAGWFVERVDTAPDTLRAIQYESQPQGADLVEGQLGMGPHTDYGVLTILLADPVPGLQVLGPDGAWHDLIATDGAFIINIGDLIAQWTNDRWVSAVHRVLPPARLPDRPAIRRSIPFFKEANADTVIRCLESCCSESRPARYEPMLAGEHLMAKLLGPRLQRTAETISTIGERAVGVGIPAK
ncbi:MAG TPA: 2-oxoglutarate and iron-dependent oxygenase domain-containing protein [Candidatus Acidoferrum sp.]|jgi:isopenicillin N synthase-like dioxygenase|nr:2-oxoglutarate and iron-dependent oxygenase domain-containing protein [Candidatus Acidoferrum sp.]